MPSPSELREAADQAELDAARAGRAAKEADRAKRKEEAAVRIEEARRALDGMTRELEEAAKKLQGIGGLGTEWATVMKLANSTSMLAQRLEDRLKAGQFFVYDGR